MDVEIDHRDPLDSPMGPGMHGGDGGVVEQAEAHRAVAVRRDGRAGGRRRRPPAPNPSMTASTAMQAPPAARAAASALPLLMTVSPSSCTGSPGSGRIDIIPST